MTPIRVLIIDDEALARERLIRLLHEFDHIDVIGEAQCVAEACVVIDALRPDLIFLDIRLGDGDAFDILSNINHIPRIIFATAFTDYAHRAFEHRAVDYLLKPVDSTRLTDAIGRMSEPVAEHPAQALEAILELASSLRQRHRSTSFPVTLGDRTLFIRFDDITYFEARDKLVFLATRDKKEYPLDASLTKLIESLPGQFVQIHRSFVINRDHLTEIHRYFSGKYKLLLGKPMIVTIESGVTYKEVVDELKQAM